MKKRSYGFTTRQIHSGKSTDPTTGAINVPIYATSTYIQESPGKHKGFQYARGQNPTRFAYEKCVADLEEGSAGFAFSSGLAASATIFELIDTGSHIIAMDDLFGGTYRLLENIRKRSAGIIATYADLSKSENLKNALTPKTKMIWVETPTNPMLKISDLEMIADFGRKNRLITVCDNTFASPYLQNPIKFGFDISLHSSTKYINGHSDVIGGIAIAGKNAEIAERIKYLQNAIGSVPSPFDCFLLHRGIKTLSLRMEAHSNNAHHIAEWLQNHPKISKVYYPGLKSHNGHEIAKKQMKLFGGMITAEIKGGLPASRKFLERCSLFALAESLGGVESLIEHPAIMTHAAVPKLQREKLGISDGLVRISVGVENREDLLDDLKFALK
ncbi:MAG: PLP-dependent aspartate aminotransferase family protein [Leptospira sp.]|nr:PLP-dependent aspartate aminotransferase family protein [Leptospira sp.]